MVRSEEALSVLLHLTRNLTEGGPLEDALLAVTDALLLLMPAEHSSVRVLDDTATQLVCGARSGKGYGHRPLAFRPGEGIIGWVAEHGKVARIHDVDEDPRFKPAPPGQGFEVRSILAVPLRSGGKVVGVLSASAPLPNTFTEQHEIFARLLANFCVPLIDKSRVERLAGTDYHTRAFNQRYLIPRLEEEIERSRRYLAPLTLMWIDLDRFRTINESHGFASGDWALRSFAELVRRTVRRPDVLVRRGGEEFVLILPSTRADQSKIVAERLRANVARDGLMAGENLQVRPTLTIGIAGWDGKETPQRLEKRVQIAMMEGKRFGGDIVSIAPDPSELPAVKSEPPLPATHKAE